MCCIPYWEDTRLRWYAVSFLSSPQSCCPEGGIFIGNRELFTARRTQHAIIFRKFSWLCWHDSCKFQKENAISWVFSFVEDACFNEPRSLQVVRVIALCWGLPRLQHGARVSGRGPPPHCWTTFRSRRPEARKLSQILQRNVIGIDPGKIRKRFALSFRSCCGMRMSKTKKPRRRAAAGPALTSQAT